MRIEENLPNYFERDYLALHAALFKNNKNNELIDVSETNNFFLSLELKLVGHKDDITPLYRYNCPTNEKHAVRAFF